VSLQEPVRVILEIRRTQATISGQLAVDGAPASGFYGWLELIDELDRGSGPQQLDLGCRAEADPGDE
jgi:hypothetical protein